MARMPGVPWREAASWSSGRPLGPVRFIVIHCTDNSEGPTAAESGAAYDSRRTDGTSAHFMVDSDSFIQEVDTANRAHGSLYHGNAWGVQVEITGRASQTRAQWLDPVSRATIANTAKICAWINGVHNLPRTRLIGSQVRTGKGITSHGDITVGFPEDGGSHTDPGPNFPWDVLLADIDAEMGDGMAIADDVWAKKVGSSALGIPEKEVTEWLKSFELGARDARAGKDAALALAETLAVVAAKLDALTVKVDAIALAAGDPDAVADKLAQRLAE